MRYHLSLLAALLLLPPAAACDRCFSEVPPQPADGVYTVSPELPDKECFWMYRADLRAGENFGEFISRAMDEKHELNRVRRNRECSMGEDGYLHRHEGVPEVHARGTMLHNPQAAEECRSIPWPEYRDNNMDFAGNRARNHQFFLAVEFYPRGIKVQQGAGYAWEEVVATAAPQWWSWERAEEFLAALPELLKGDPASLTLPNGLEELPPHLQERIKSARRMVFFYADKKMPIAPYWEWWAKLVQIADPQCVEYSRSPNVIISPAEAVQGERERCMPPEWREKRRAERAEAPPLELPRHEAELQIELPEIAE